MVKLRKMVDAHEQAGGRVLGRYESERALDVAAGGPRTLAVGWFHLIMQTADQIRLILVWPLEDVCQDDLVLQNKSSGGQEAADHRKAPSCPARKGTVSVVGYD